jgi:hypothetical protein
MKKIIYLLCAFTFFSLRISAQCTGFTDGFESGSYSPNWTLGPSLTTATVNTITPYAGTYKFEGTGGTNSHLTGLTSTFSPSTSNTISWAIYPTGTLASNYFVAGDNATAATNCIVFAYWIGGNNIRFVSSAITATYVATPNQWYNIELKNINYTTRTFDIYVNNVLIQTAFPFRSNTISNVSRLYLYNFNTGSTGAWDDIKVGGFNINASASPATCFGSNNGSATVTTVGGTAPFTYSWTPTANTTSVISGLSAGAYSCIAIDANTCVATTSVNVLQPPAITLTVNQTNINCFNQCNGTATANVSGGVGSFTYSWTPIATTSLVANLCAGTYTSSVQDANGCIVTKTISITQPTAAVSSIINTSTITCINAVAQATSNTSGGTSPYTYTWSANSSTTNIANNLSGGNYTCTIIDNLNCALTKTFVVTTNTTPPTVTAVSNLSLICTGQSASLSATGASNYTWSSGPTASVIVVSPTVTTTYTVKGLNAVNGCTANATVVQNVSACTGIDNLVNNVNSSILIYPNPANDHVTIELTALSETIIQLELVNTLGQVMQSQEASNLSKLQLTNLPNGVYFVRLVSDNNVIATKKIIKQ